MLKYILLAVLLLFIFIIWIFYVALAPTIRDLSDRPVFKPLIGKSLVLEHPARVYILPEGQYNFCPELLTIREIGTYPLKYELPAGTVMIIRSFKTYTNNAGSGTTSLYALGDFLTKDGEKVNFQYAWTYEYRTENEDMDKLPLAIWQKPGEPRFDYPY
jgi:hypothetical protein